ncbi:MAG: UDP-3-O-(3-hydroxymyristoyl)glucosamine N-acyltransferase [Planctomycetales bacterium]|nr:UDP-3-O-(3-hydroxymyristoyl)glucosamine N-acyltransferase [Planctomycetales bacterium]
MSFTLGELSRLVQGQLHGDPSIVICGTAIIRDAQAGQLTLADSDKALAKLATCGAAAVMTRVGMDTGSLPRIEVEDVSSCFARVTEVFRPRQQEGQRGVSTQAFVDPTAVIGSGATIFPGAYVGAGVVIGDGVTLHPGVCVMAGSSIGDHTTIFANAVLYEGTDVGRHVIIHASAVLGAYGFGYNSSTGRHLLSEQSGYVKVEDHVEIGAGATIDRGTYGATVIGEGTKIDNQVMVAHNCHIGRHNLLCSQVGIAGSCTTGDYVVMAGQVGIGDHLNIGHKTILGAKAGVMSDVPSDVIYVGIPATPHREQMQKQAAWSKLPEMRKEFKTLKLEVERLKSLLSAPSQTQTQSSSSEDDSCGDNAVSDAA